MIDKIIIGGALANIHGQAKTQDLVDFLAEGADELAVYVLRPRPGSITAAAFDWQAILGTTADFIAVGGLLWAAYERFIKPIRERERNSRSFLYIVVKHPDGRSIQFSLGIDVLDQKDFIKLFNQACEGIRLSTDSKPQDDSEIQYIENSDIWVRIKKRTPNKFIQPDRE